MDMSKPTYALLPSLLAAILIAAGCGEDSSLTKAEFIEQADAICRKSDQKKTVDTEEYVLKIGLGPGNPMTKAEQEFQTKKILLPPIRSAIQQMSELSAPEGDEEKIDRLIKNLEAASDETEERSEKTNVKYSDPYTEAAKEAREYGFKACFVYY